MQASVKRLAVHIGGRFAGTLEQGEGGALSFSYVDEYDGADLSLSMPKSGCRFEGRPVKAYLAGLLPDSADVRKAMAMRFGVSSENPFAMLTNIGRDCPGAVSFRRQDDGADEPSENLVPVDSAWVARKFERLAGGDPRWMSEGERWTLAGAQAKFAMHEAGGAWFVCEGGQPSTRILKPGISHLESQALNEYIMLRTAKRLGLEVEDVGYLEFDGVPAIIARRFDRVETAGGVEKVHQEDLCQALAVDPTKKYAYEGGPGASDVAKLLAKSGPHADDNVRRFIDALLFNALTGSTDAHAKNYSVLLTQNGSKLAPLYDIATIIPYLSNPRKPIKLAMGIGGENRAGKLGRNNLETFCKAGALDEVGITAEDIAHRVEELATAIPDAMRSAFQDVSRFEGADELAAKTIPGIERICDLQLASIGA